MLKEGQIVLSFCIESSNARYPIILRIKSKHLTIALRHSTCPDPPLRPHLIPPSYFLCSTSTGLFTPCTGNTPKLTEPFYQLLPLSEGLSSYLHMAGSFLSFKTQHKHCLLRKAFTNHLIYSEIPIPLSLFNFCIRHHSLKSFCLFTLSVEYTSHENKEPVFDTMTPLVHRQCLLNSASSST